MTTEKRRLILDVDAGADSAAAILLAALSERIELLGLTAAWGGIARSDTAKQVLMLAEFLKCRAPVYAGCPGPMARGLYRQTRGEAAGREDGVPAGCLDELHLPDPKARVQEKHAVEYLVEACRSAEDKLTIVAAGPPTNLGVALRIAPDIAEHIEEIVVVGGGVGQSSGTLCAEENMLRDPEAAEIVVKSGAPATFITMDAAGQAALPKEYIEKCRALKNPVGDVFAELLRQRLQLQSLDAAPLCAALGIASLIDPAVITQARGVHLSVCLDHGKGAGAFLTDARPQPLPENARVASGADSGKLGQIVMETLKSAKGLFDKGEYNGIRSAC